MINNDKLTKICIIGKNQLHYGLLSFCLEKELHAKCAYHTELPPAEFFNNGINDVAVWLVDCQRYNPEELDSHLNHYKLTKQPNAMVALFNVSPDCDLEKLVKQHKIRGLFYTNDSRSVFLKGIRSILSGRLWLSRKILSNCILKFNDLPDPSLDRCDTLSCREKVVLKNLSSGATNQEIADNLRISVHTVKTHLYKIYRKINVPNRLEASIWANDVL